jgi:hypothetical protein
VDDARRRRPRELRLLLSLGQSERLARRSTDQWSSSLTAVSGVADGRLGLLLSGRREQTSEARTTAKINCHVGAGLDTYIAHQFHSPSSSINDGTSKARITEASISTASAVPSPSCLMKTSFAVDHEGNVYITTDECLVREISTGGTITAVAGKPPCGSFSGDGCPATSAQIGGEVAGLLGVWGLALDT